MENVIVNNSKNSLKNKTDMKTNNLIFLFIMLFNAIGLNSFAYVVNIDGISYDVVKKLKEATVISAGHRDNIVIPEYIEYEGTQCAVTSIGMEAFHDHSTSFTITIPKTIKSIGRDAFKGCGFYNNVNITDIEAWCEISFESNSNPIRYASHVYLNGEELKDLIIPNGVTSISNTAFGGIETLNSVTIPNGLTEIGNNAFSGCINLKSITIPNSVVSIGESAFSSCRGLKEIEIPNSVTSIGNSAFEGCWGLKKFIFPDHITEIKDKTLKNCSSLEYVTIPNGVTWIRDNAFYGCEKLISINIPSSVTYIGENAFADCI